MKSVLLPVVTGLLLSFTGCQHLVGAGSVEPAVAPPAAYSIVTLPEVDPSTPWWREFDDPLLTALLRQTLDGNLSLEQAVARVGQAESRQAIAGSTARPMIDGQLSSTGSRYADGERSHSHRLSLNLAWEIDLWKRLSAGERAEAFEYLGELDAFNHLKVLVTGQAAIAYLGIIEDGLLLDLLRRQIKTNTTVLELIRLRVANGQASLLDLHQQKQNLAALEAQLPAITQSRVEKANRLAVLTGRAPTSVIPETSLEIPVPKEVPKTGIPATLLQRRFDLQQLQKEVMAADHRVAAAVAARLPQLKIGGATGISGAAFAGDNLFFSLFGEVLAPLIDWRRRKEEVKHAEAVVEERVAAYAEAFLTALEEVENTLQSEESTRRHIQALLLQRRTALDTYREGRNRYLQGVTDYLPVIIALQAAQRTEQEIIRARGRLAANRVLLHRALGGAPL